MRNSYCARQPGPGGKCKLAHRRFNLSRPGRSRHHKPLPLGSGQLGSQGQCSRPGVLRLDIQTATQEKKKGTEITAEKSTKLKRVCSAKETSSGMASMVTSASGRETAAASAD